MQFSIFGVQFKCTKDMFAWGKFKWSIYIYWAEWWRSTIIQFILGGIFLILGNAILNFDRDGGFLWEIFYFCRLGLYYFVTACIQYYVYFRKAWYSFNRQFIKGECPIFWSWDFWKPYSMIVAIKYLFSAGLNLFFGKNVFSIFQIMLFQKIPLQPLEHIFDLVFLHLFLHGGTWGVVPKRKEASLIENKEATL